MRPRHVTLTALTTLLASLALTASATGTTVFRWGSYFCGSTRTRTGRNAKVYPTPVDLSPVTMVEASNSSSYALKADGETVWAWGDGTGRPAGDGSEASSSNPVQVEFPKGIVITTIGESKNQAYGIDSNGEAWTWGQGSSDCMAGRLHRKPVKIPGLNNLVAVQGGGNHVVWLERNGEVLGCGTNYDGQLGLGQDVRARARAARVPACPFAA